MLLSNKYPLMDKAGGDGGSGDGGGGGGKGGDDGKGSGGDGNDLQTKQVELLTKSVGLLAEGLQKMEANQASVIEALAKITDRSKSDIKHDIKAEFGADVDLEQLSRKDFAAIIMRSLKTEIAEETKKLTGDVDTRVKDLSARFESKNAGDQINHLAKDNDDFWEWSTEIKALLTENPTLTVKRAYTLAKQENEDKAKKMAEKYKKEEKKTEPEFIGLTPTSSLAVKGAGGKMSPSEAAEAAFATVMGNLGSRIDNGDIRIA